jgi:hypothetical protein
MWWKRANNGARRHDSDACRPGLALERATPPREAAAAGAEQLRCQVLHEIADGNPEASALAREVIATIDEDIGGD